MLFPSGVSARPFSASRRKGAVGSTCSRRTRSLLSFTVHCYAADDPVRCPGGLYLWHTVDLGYATGLGQGS